MNNLLFINNLKNKNMKNSYVQQSSDTNTCEYYQNPTTINDDNKFNPDVEQNYALINSRRENASFSYSSDMWKPIIGSINKQTITKDDFIIKVEKPSEEQRQEMQSTYEAQMEERLLEKKRAESMALEYNIKNNLDKPKIEKIQIPDNIDLSLINNTFDELKSASANIQSDNIDTDAILNSMSKLDDLINSIKNL